MHYLRRAGAHDFDVLATVYFERIDAPGGILSSLLSTRLRKKKHHTTKLVGSMRTSEHVPGQPDALYELPAQSPSRNKFRTSLGTGSYLRTAERDIFIKVNASDRVARREELTKYDRVILEVLQWITTCGFQGGSRLWPCRGIGESLLDVHRYGDTVKVPLRREEETQ